MLEHFALALREAERVCGLKPCAPATFEGFQQWPHRYLFGAGHDPDCPGCTWPPLPLFTLTEPVDEYPRGTTLSATTLTELGFSLPNHRVTNGTG